jgi:hypothetical protein
MAGVAALAETVGAVFSFIIKTVGIIITAPFSWLFGSEELSTSVTQEFQDSTSVTNGSTTPQNIVYGTTRIGGQILNIESTGELQNNLGMAIVLAAHPIDCINKIYVDDRLSTASELQGKFEYLFVDGTQTTVPQFAIDIMPSWTNQHLALGKAVLYCKLVYDEDVYRGVPKINVEVRGKRVYDPRDGQTKFSDNWALCCADYLTGYYGANRTYDDLDTDSLINSANISDELTATGQRTIKVLSGGDYVDQLIPAGTEKRYTINGSFRVLDRPLDKIDELSAAGAGKIVNNLGKWYFFAGAYKDPEMVFNEMDVLGDINLQVGGDFRNRINTVKGTYADVSMEHQPTDFKVVTSEDYITKDGGEVLEQDMQLNFTNSPYTASRIGKILMERSRVGAFLTVKLKTKVLALRTFDTMVLYNKRLGWDAMVYESDGVTPLLIDGVQAYGKVFRIVAMSGVPTDGIDVTLHEEYPSIYTWEEGDTFEIEPVPLTTLPNPYFLDAPKNIDVIEDLFISVNGGQVKNKALVSWEAGDALRTTRYELWVQRITAPAYSRRMITETTSTVYEIQDIEPGQYTLYVRAKNSLNVASAFTAFNHEILGKLAPPSDVLGFSVVFTRDGARLEWQPIPDLDSDLYEIRVGTTWESSTKLIETRSTLFTWAQFTAGEHNVLIKAKDTTGNYSLNATLLTFNIQAPTKIQTITPQVIDNYVTMQWGQSSATYPIEQYIIKRGDVLANAVEVGRAQTTFTVIFEQRKGIFKYWIAAMDIGGNMGEYYSVNASLDSPPDYILRSDTFLDLQSANSTNIVYQDDKGVTFDSVDITWDNIDITWDEDVSISGFLPVLDTQTFDEWLGADPNAPITFDSIDVTWDSVDVTWDEASETYEQFLDRTNYQTLLDPYQTTAQWQKVIDYEATLPPTRITFTVDFEVQVGTITYNPKIETSLDEITWEVYDGVTQTSVNQFRYVRFTLDFVGDGQSYGILDSIRAKLDVKNKTDQGRGFADLNDVDGTEFFFNTEFSDIDSIVPAIDGDTNGTAIPIFNDVPNPVSFMVKCYDINGNRISSNITWIARGL